MISTMIKNADHSRSVLISCGDESEVSALRARDFFFAFLLRALGICSLSESSCFAMLKPSSSALDATAAASMSVNDFFSPNPAQFTTSSNSEKEAFCSHLVVEIPDPSRATLRNL